MQRREFITLIGGAAAAWPLAARAQQPAKIARIGYLLTGSLTETRVNIDAFREGLILSSATSRARASKLNRGLRMVGSSAFLVWRANWLLCKVDVIVAAATPAGRAAQQATSTIPIIVSAMGDPVNDGLVASLARPGGNITGTSFLGPELVPKRIGFLKEILPKISRVAVLWHPGAFSDRTTAEMLKETTDASASLGMQLQFLEVRSPDELEHAFSTITKARV